MPDTDTRLSMAEQLSATYDKLEAEQPATETTETELAAVAETETAEVKAERARDEAGKFAKEQPREKLTLKPKEGKDAAPKQERTPERQEPGAKVGAEAQPAKAEAGGEVIPPPSHWNGNGKVAWEKLPFPVKQTLSKEYASVADLRPVATVIEPYKARFQQEFGGTDRALGAILDTWKFARSDPSGFVRQFVQQFNIDPQSLGFSGQVQQQQPGGNAAELQSGDPAFAAMQQRLAAAEARVEALAQQPVQAQHAQIQTEIQSFGSETDQSGKLAHPWFNDVRPIMGALMASGQAKTLKDAYDQACYANPTIRDGLLRDAVAADAIKRRAAADKATQRGGSITGSPGVARAETQVKQSARADLEANWDKLEARV